VYNLHMLDNNFSAENEQMMDEVEATTVHLKFVTDPRTFKLNIIDRSICLNRKSSALDRSSLNDGGLMVKSTSIQASYGHSYVAEVNTFLLSSDAFFTAFPGTWT
jgi:hypothetical protein